MTVHCLLQQILCLGDLFLRLAALGTDIVLCPEELLDGFPQGQCIFLILQQGEENRFFATISRLFPATYAEDSARLPDTAGFTA